MKLENKTPFSAAWTVLLDKRGAETLVLAVKATYVFDGTGRVTVAQKPSPIRLPDVFYGEPGRSSVRYEAELCPCKPATDAVLVGDAIAPAPGTTQLDVSLRVGPLFKKVRVFGERRWKKSLFGGYTLSDPEPFERLPLVYENAFGGKDTSSENPKHHAQEARNPLGRGFRAKKSELDFVGLPAPSIEDPNHLLNHPGDGPAPQGFGFIGRDWQPRVSYCGTYDAQWREERAPLLPLDFDERFHKAAHPDLVAPGHLTGNEVVEIVGCRPEGRVRFALPGSQPKAGIVLGGKAVPLDLRLNTILLDTLNSSASLLWKGSLDINRKLPDLTCIHCSC